MRNFFALALTLGLLSPLAPLAAETAEVAAGTGTVVRVDAAAATLNMKHEAIPALKWPAMTMDFKVSEKKLLTELKPGQAVRFGLVRAASGQYVISRIEPVK